MAALVVLVRRDLGDAGLARRSVWLLALAPPAYSLVLGYADAALLLCSVVTVLAARTGRWWWAAAAGLVAGLVRPVGVLLVVPVVIEVWRSCRGDAPGAPVAGPPGRAGRSGGGDGRLPGLGAVPSSATRGCRSGSSSRTDTAGSSPCRWPPWPTIWLSVVHGHHLGSALHIPWVVLCVGLLVVAFRRLPSPTPPSPPPCWPCP